MTAMKAGESPACTMTRLNGAIEQKLDFALSYQEEDALLTLRSILGLVRRMIFILDNFDTHGGPVLRIPLRREPKCVGASLKEIVQKTHYKVESHERTGRSLVVITGAYRSDIDVLIADCLAHVEDKLSD